MEREEGHNRDREGETKRNDALQISVAPFYTVARFARFCAPGNWFPRDLIRKILPPRPPFHADGAVGRADGALLTARVARKAVEPALEAAHKLAGFTREPQSMRCPFEAPTNVELFC